jgi:hypothetical protein
MNYTKGEWKLSPVDKGGYSDGKIISDGFVGSIATVNMDCYDFKGNANLISAAPNMYVALKAIQNLCNGYAEIDREQCGLYIQNILNKAEGL